MNATADILIVDDDASLRGALQDYLSGAGYGVRTADGGAAMDARLAEAMPDLVVLDVMMPGEDGLSICRRLQGRAPVLMLSAMGETTDRIVGLEVGAADYLPKPFEPRELLARIRAVLRRPVHADEAMDRGLAFEGWTLEVEARRLSDPGGEAVELTAGEFALLLTFMRSGGRILSRDQILENTHGPLAENFDRAVDLAVSRLRRKLDRPGQAPLIETVRGAGYRFRAPVRR
ncbi:response regulator transcription factor [Brevundimonas sp. NPDC003935]|uniref:response regulator transcription factor n=1 Tax=unclassified Brevundimonas TaxID=2622653 RepID=UPI002898505D|nr:response regulator transcription factor [Brevundimonas sp.]